MDLKKENIVPYLEVVSKLDQALFLLTHVDNKIKYDDDETISFDLEVCEVLLLQIVNSPLLASANLDHNFPEKQGGDLSMMLERLRPLIGSIKSDVHKYLVESLSF
jgi:hypothetical protein